MKKIIYLASFLFLTSMGVQAAPIVSESYQVQQDDKTDAARHKEMVDQTVYIKNGQKSVSFEVAKLTGGKINLSDYKGKVIHLCFWASWCGPCLKELKQENLPTVIAPYRKKSDYVLIPIALEKKEAVEKFFASPKGKEYAWLRDLTGYDPVREQFNKYAKQGIPRTVVIDREGNVVETSIGGSHYEMNLIKKALESLY